MFDLHMPVCSGRPCIPNCHTKNNLKHQPLVQSISTDSTQNNILTHQYNHAGKAISKKIPAAMVAG